ncbi:glycine cleavage system aminomethyltransferase GcvT [Pseudonocardia sp.]|jgi:aminomethyltransferase|uniref:glycine cleavage system aminomethyltransferase GcvT n=1 Tax=Pseudonocardia sp. TaxID=60912 RepID=UPI00260242F2|nr:glycine cleavage system aminomethyltransferase GcvT [Pseudonocardia sp.]MCW2716792.1 gcvT [Pseudonocardia sp.]MDT7614005.1 aminomethyltransferase [Pseudonocardiales bacterium]
MTGIDARGVAPQITALHGEHDALQATFTDFAGWRMPLRYSGDLAEHHAVRSAAGLFDLSHMGEIMVTGAGAAAALDRALVVDASAIGVGRARYTVICAPDGGILDDLIVYRLAEREYLVVANAANAPMVAAELAERATGARVAVFDATTEFALVAIQGPVAAAILAPLCSIDLPALRYYASASATVAGRPVLLARTGYTGEEGFELFCVPDDAPFLWRSLLEAGAGDGLLPAGLACRDTLRLEAGMPLHGHELHSGVTPFHAGLGRVVSFDKPGDFVGRAALAAVAGSGPEQVLVGLVGDSRRAPRHGYPVLDPDTGSAIGTITSGAPSPTLGRPIAMAYVVSDRAVPGTRLVADVRGKHEPVTVVELPFYRRPTPTPATVKAG